MTHKLPNALILGPMRTGSTWCYNYLKNRGDVDLPRRVKETFFFDRYYARGADWYARQFHSVSEVCVEVAPSYFAKPDLPDKVYRTLGPIPLVAVLRNPVDRAYSHYQHLVRYGLARGGFQDVVRESGLWRDGQFGRVLAEWDAVFGPKSVALLDFDEIAARPKQFAAALDTCLGLETHCGEAVPPSALNGVTAGARPYLASVTTRVADYLRSCGAHSVVNVVRDLPYAKRAVYGSKATNRPSLPYDDRMWFYERYVLPDLGRLKWTVPPETLARWID
ncbi:MAG: sulfotransferase domain-containing protein [Pseudomonadota bacterium]